MAGRCPGGGRRPRPAPYQQQVPGESFYPMMEIVDGAAVPAGWTLPGFDDSDWAPAAELRGELLSEDRYRVPCTPFAAMEPSGIAPLTADPQTVVPLSIVEV